MRVGNGIVGGVVLAAVLAGCSEGARRPEYLGETPAATQPSGSPPSAGWRWESFRNVEVSVPDGWKTGAYSTGQLTSQWCIGDDQPPVAGAVARPGFQTQVFCQEGDGRSGTRIATAGVFVGFEDATESTDGVRHDGDRTTVTIDGVAVLVQAETSLRERIVATIRTVSVDHNGCPVTHEISADPAYRPARSGGSGEVTGLAACRYETGRKTDVRRPGLISSLRLGGDAARAVLDAIAAAPVGGGPNSPDTCAVEIHYGSEAIVLVVEPAGGGTREIVVRFSGCNHNGIDDGTTVRRLTRDAVAPVVAGPNQPGGWSGGNEKNAILTPR